MAQLIFSNYRMYNEYCDINDELDRADQTLMWTIKTYRNKKIMKTLLPTLVYIKKNDSSQQDLELFTTRLILVFSPLKSKIGSESKKKQMVYERHKHEVNQYITE